MADKSRILIVGGTGYIGKFLVAESVKQGNPTFVLVRDSTTKHPEKSKLIDKFKTLGATILNGDIHDHESLVKAIKQVDVVISAVGVQLLANQVKLIAAIKEAGNVKRFLPSEFGNDVDRVIPVEPAKSIIVAKVSIRRAIEAANIPHTFVACNGFAGIVLPTVGHKVKYATHRENISIRRDENPKLIVVKEEDIALTTIKAVDDPRTLNKTLIFRPPGNILSFNEIVSIWESKIGKTLGRTYVSEDQLLKNIQVAPSELSSFLSIIHTISMGDATSFEIDPSFGVEASELYPEIKYTTVVEYLSQLA
ncbi:hypothetical protein L1987_66310 [Smallanthus sonchifolius]|uniref:Uncharacterized protein n=1 Tax=Smallanthus sonchifolius TaxID=185202 RepID=A0ACB9BX28_9ASTR|nr:hypothetical protein L1987_66310 [Smallanthus sonchifolius]